MVHCIYNDEESEGGKDAAQSAGLKKRTKKNMATPILPSPKLAQMVAELNAQIRRECGEGNYALIGSGQVACLMGFDDAELARAFPMMPKRTMLPAQRPMLPAARKLLPFQALIRG